MLVLIPHQILKCPLVSPESENVSGLRKGEFLDLLKIFGGSVETSKNLWGLVLEPVFREENAMASADVFLLREESPTTENPEVRNDNSVPRLKKDIFCPQIFVKNFFAVKIRHSLKTVF